MKKLFILFVLAILPVLANATNFIINIVGTSYSPDLVTCNVGDVVTIAGSDMHPLVQVDKATWNASGNTPMVGGWGTKTTSYDFTATVVDTIYFVCQVHVAFGMKGRIIVQAAATAIENPLSPKILVSIYPNPITNEGLMKVVTTQGSTISASIFALNGQLVKQVISNEVIATGEYNVSFGVRDMANGEYYMVVNENQKRYSRMFAVVK